MLSQQRQITRVYEAIRGEPKPDEGQHGGNSDRMPQEQEGDHQIMEKAQTYIYNFRLLYNIHPLRSIMLVLLYFYFSHQSDNF